MSEILDLAKSITKTKNALKTAIVSRGVAVAESDPFSAYPGKISRIARDPAIWARNDLGRAPSAGEKVLLQPLHQTAGLAGKFFSATQINSRGGLRMMPYTATRFMLTNAPSGQQSVSAWSEEGGLSEIYRPTNGFTTFDPVIYNYVFLSPYLYWIHSWRDDSGSNQNILLTPDRQMQPASYNYFLANGYMLDFSGSGNGTVKSYDPVNGTIGGETIAVFESGVGDPYNANAWCGFSGSADFINRQNSQYRIYKNNSGVMQEVYRGSHSLFGEGTGYFLGVTADNRYIVFNTYKNNACYPRLLKVNDDWSLEEDTTLALEGTPAYYPWLQLLITNSGGAIRLFKYSGGRWVEETVDFPDTFGQLSQATVNYDGSQIFINDCSDFNSGTAYLYNLTVSAPGRYKAMPATPLNYNTACITGWATGEIDPAAGTAEVNALQPPVTPLPPVTTDQ